MNLQDQIKALAELDGWKSVMQSYHNDTWFGVAPGWEKSIGYDGNVVNHTLPDYLESYDAIIPLIQKICATEDQQHMFCCHTPFESPNYTTTADVFAIITMTPAQLCEALLRATGKWIE